MGLDRVNFLTTQLLFVGTGIKRRPPALSSINWSQRSHRRVGMACLYQWLR